MTNQTRQQVGELECVIVRDSKLTTPAAAIILCHGFGAPSTDLVSLGSELIAADPSFAQVVFIFPGAPLELDPTFDARAWWMIDVEKIQQLMERGETREMRSTAPDRLPLCREAIIQVIEFARKEYSLKANQIVVGGFSQGSMLATDVALHYAEPLGGLIIWSGALINEPVWQKFAKQQKQLRIVQTHGRIDPILPIEGGESLRELLKSAGHRVAYHEFNGPHTIPMEGLQLAAQLIAEVVGDE
jgi:phospholipase/carboxylesterase